MGGRDRYTDGTELVGRVLTLRGNLNGDHRAIFEVVRWWHFSQDTLCQSTIRPIQGGGDVEGRRRVSPRRPSWGLAASRGPPQAGISEIGGPTGEQSDRPALPKPAGVAGKPASSGERAFSLWPNDVEKWRWRPCAGVETRPH
jgi:hypothetical protein